MHRFARLAAISNLALCLTLVAQDSTNRGRKYKAPPPTSRVEVTVLRREDAKPIENASVVFQLVGDKGNMELKTNEDGKAVIDVLPTGSKVVLQVLAKGYQTYGKDYSIDKSEMALEVKLNRPGKQYSIYENNPDTAKKDDGAGKDKPSNQPSPKPNASQPQQQ